MWNDGAIFSVQAESGTIGLAQLPDRSSTQVRDSLNPEGTGWLRPDYSGSGYVDFGNDGGDRLTLPVSVDVAGTYDVVIRYASRGGDRLNILVNEQPSGNIRFNRTDADGPGPAGPFDSWGLAVVRVTLPAGASTLGLAMPAGATAAPNIDAIAVFEPGAAPAPAVDTTADFGHDLSVMAPGGILNETEASSMHLAIDGIDRDIVRIQMQIDGGEVLDVTGRADAGGNVVIQPGSLAAGAHSVLVTVFDDDGNAATATTSFVTATTTPAPIQIEAENPQHVTIVDTGTGGPASVTKVDGKHAGASGNAYVDLGTNTGDGMTVNVEVPRSGIYTLTVRYANGDAASDRPMRLSVNDMPSEMVAFPAGEGRASWTRWQTVTIEVDLVEGANTLDLTLPAGATGGPNIDNFQLEFLADQTPRPADAQLFDDVIAINFEPGNARLPAGYVTPEGFVSDQGGGFGVRDNGMTYGWVDVDDAGQLTHIPMDLPADQASYASSAFGASGLYRTSASFERGGHPETERAWEMEVENGTYQIRVSVGSSDPTANSLWQLNAEGVRLVDSLAPDAAGGITSTVVTGIIVVNDGRVSLDSFGGENTAIQWLELASVPDLTPADGKPPIEDYSAFTDIRAATASGQVSLQPGGGGVVTGIATDADFVVGITIRDADHRGPNVSYADNIRLIETETGREVPITVQTTGGSDSLTISPRGELRPNTSYTLLVDDVPDLGNSQDASAPIRQIADSSTTFVTGDPATPVEADVAFTDQLLLDGFGDGAAGYTSIEFGPDGRLYATSIMGEIIRWDTRPDGTIDTATREVWAPDYLAEGDARRGVIGIAFDPENPNVIWITDNWPIPLAGKASETPEFSGRISRVTLGPDGSLADATAETYMTGLPRSGGDHVTNSLEFRPNPDAGTAGEPNYLLYVTQGSNTAGGSPDPAWGLRPERLLSASVLEIDPRRAAPPGGIDVRTEPVGPGDNPNTSFPREMFNTDGTFPGFYDPFAADAPLRIYASGVRNAYDLVWHSNGNLYVPTNGSAAGSISPDDPRTPQNEFASGAPKQLDYVFRVHEGGYYGHPNPLLDNYILNGGNPTAGVDPNEVGGRFYPVGTMPDPNYRIEDTYSLGYNVSPDGVIEYMGGAFGDALQHALVFTQFSVTDALRYATIGADGRITGVDTLRRPDGTAINTYIDPLDIIENPITGQLYVVTLNRSTGASQLVLLTPAPQADGTIPAAVAENMGATESVTAGDATAPADPSAAGVQFFDATALTVPPGTNTILRIEGDPATYEPNFRNDLDRNGLNDGYDGTSYLDLGTVAGTTASLTYVAEVAGTYTVQVRLANGTSDARPLVIASGGEAVHVADTRTGSFREWQTVEVTFTFGPGSNRIDLTQLTGQGANIDSITVIAPTIPAPTAEIRLDSLDPGIHEDRLHFSYITDPTWEGYANRDFKETATIRIHSEGDADLHINGAQISGPYRLAVPGQLDDVTIAAGSYLDVQVVFDRGAYVQRPNNVNGVVNGTLTLHTNDADTPGVDIDLRGYCQPRPERGNEPNLNEIFDIFGFGNHIEGLSYARGGENSTLAFHSLYLPVDETEVMASYWRIADGATQVEVTQLAALHAPGAANISIHAPGRMGQLVQLFTASSTDTQMLLPGMRGAEFAEASFDNATVPDWWAGDDVFAFRIGPASSDPLLNDRTPAPPTQAELDARYPGHTVDGDGIVRDPQGAIVPYGCAVHIFQALDDEGAAIDDTYIVTMDYPGMNNDFNDNVLLVRGIEPVFSI